MRRDFGLLRSEFQYYASLILIFPQLSLDVPNLSSPDKCVRPQVFLGPLEFLRSPPTIQEVAINRPCASCLNLFRFGFPKLSRHFEFCLDVSRFSSPKLLSHFESWN